MKITTLRDIAEFKELRMKLGDDVGFVPTMGNLHIGHISLIEKSLSAHEVTVVSIFVNPLQFGPNEDFDRYPRTLEADVNLISKLKDKYQDKEIIVLAPADPKQMYPAGFQTSIDIKEITKPLCGKNRPGHFSGVATVVYKLFMMVKPKNAYFGQKDYQQVCLIKRLVTDLDLPVHIVMGEIIRDEKGLAFSSRNQYLSANEYEEAMILPNSIKQIKDAVAKNPSAYTTLPTQIMSSHPHFDYLELRDAETLELIGPTTSKVVIAGAYRAGKTRLIDNQLIDWNKNA